MAAVSLTTDLASTQQRLASRRFDLRLDAIRTLHALKRHDLILEHAMEEEDMRVMDRIRTFDEANSVVADAGFGRFGLRAETERQRAEEERQRAAREKQRADALASKLRELGVDPDTI